MALPAPASKNFGCGFIQLTGKANYRRHGLAIGEPLLEQPERTNEPAIAAVLYQGQGKTGQGSAGGGHLIVGCAEERGASVA